MEANDITVAEQVPASRKLQSSDAAELLDAADHLVVAKGKKLTEFDVRGEVSDDAVAAMLGPTGNLRSPTIKVGKKLLVGFNEDAFAAAFK